MARCFAGRVVGPYAQAPHGHQSLDGCLGFDLVLVSKKLSLGSCSLSKIPECKCGSLMVVFLEFVAGVLIMYFCEAERLKMLDHSVCLATDAVYAVFPLWTLCSLLSCGVAMGGHQQRVSWFFCCHTSL
ncbi:hypothetical protein Nepgr_031309 [Nepenthes gracilis]|uniref:Uncharacterized protein n=1 Tax=Nepenthes gracilis TaxID=150966 RepID=A0AAD3TI79_NEPGR|nr:hypothetical protein Nepgr_031309 [Nepenthes gracilis]